MAQATPDTPDTEMTKAFLAFCRGKPAGEIFDAGNSECCALAQFGKPGLNLSNTDAAGVPRAIYRLTVWAEPHDFGALASRLEAALAEQA